MSNKIELAKCLLAWNQTNINSNSHIAISDIAHFFAEKFELIANEKHYDANYSNYLEFLNQFKENIIKLSHDVHKFVDAGDIVVMPMTATILFEDNTETVYEAIMMFTYDNNDKIIEWREVCVET